mmetsp:Transcript_29186/g.62541  ORF Transcript_29186/g.62541 Transcript_29186/m.62541 type:complete len:768 (+) Transcript_29186:141-2444(+)|eukprot:CAMPEP_0201123404 /NCGR_PEP_ID=MMETSP0850-20130426/6771_1 /ASSEMBLY_ACC=CAM_ASM_000622 /TAXON_ID=183588 /ORGANISM="Pseudo-nitzschia fraudulenta, Strain WWA7" /LENGTH=767 /DNA_ID=CAMNT_0047390295 /DNA_START=128 /DNA_END=2431 /DNA_ORIENTATION=-
MTGKETDENTTMTDVSDSPKKPPTDPSDDTSTKATEENDSDTANGATGSSDEGKEDGDAETTNDEDSTEKDTRTQEEKDDEAREKEEAEKRRIEELTIKYKDWPWERIKEYGEHDVLFGRGGGTNHHKGNKRYRKMVEDRKVRYVNCKRLDKPLVALEIIKEWRNQFPPGRFLKFDEKKNEYNDVGDKKAREKTSQALREKAPQIRKQQEDEKHEGDGADDKATGKERKKKPGKPAKVERNHSLGTEVMNEGEDRGIDPGFAWVDGATSNRGAVLPPGGNAGIAHGQPGITNPPDYYGNTSVGEPTRQFSNGSFSGYQFPPGREFSLGSFGSHGGYGAFGPPFRQGSYGSIGSFSGPGGPTHRRSGSWSDAAPPTPHDGFTRQRSGSWNAPPVSREHSLSGFPLPHTNLDEPLFQQTGYGNPSMPPGQFQGSHYLPPPPPPRPPPQPFSHSPGRHIVRLPSDTSIGTIGSPAQGPHRKVATQSQSGTPTPPYDPSDWSRSAGQYPPGRDGGPYNQFNTQPQPGFGTDTNSQRSHPLQNGQVARPAMIKRDTSNQNETYETKRSLKKAALNRDQSATSNRLKQRYIPQVLDMQSLQNQTEGIKLNSPSSDEADRKPPAKSKPTPLKQSDRKATVDIVNEMFLTDTLPSDLPPDTSSSDTRRARPMPLSQSDRQGTATVVREMFVSGELPNELPPPPSEEEVEVDIQTSSDSFVPYRNINDDLQPQLSYLPRPGNLSSVDRLTTTDGLLISDALNDFSDDNCDEDPLPM